MLRQLAIGVVIVGLASAPAGAQRVITVSFDVLPQTCPNLFNPYRGGNLPTAVLGTPELDAPRIQPGSLVLVVPGGGGLLETRIHPISTELLDVATPVSDPTDCRCTDAGPEGLTDMAAYFDPIEVGNALCQNCEFPRWPVCIEGLLEDGTPFRGCDCIQVVTPVSVGPSSWGSTKASYR